MKCTSQSVSQSFSQWAYSVQYSEVVIGYKKSGRRSRLVVADIRTAVWEGVGHVESNTLRGTAASSSFSYRTPRTKVEQHKHRETLRSLACSPPLRFDPVDCPPTDMRIL